MRWKMAKPSTAPVAESCAEPTSTGGTWAPADVTMREEFAGSGRSKEEAKSGPVLPTCCGKTRGSAKGPLTVGSMASPKKLRRASAEEGVLFTRVNRVVQFSAAARWGMEPMKLRPVIEPP